ncbi:MAG: hypothetical protein DMF85_00340 [Acidobacteria bacterium]|nr:MAG: hypothetical protein DMF85_00340 [Acidobacteriota bacterium]
MGRLLAAVIVACLVPHAQDRFRTVYVTAVDSRGAPVTDLSAAEFAVKEGGQSRAVVRAEPATAPLHVALLIDDNGTGIFRYSVARFIDRLLGRGQFTISTVTGQPLKLVDYTANVEALNEAVGKLTARPATPDGGQLLEAIFEAAKDFQRREAARPIIVALTVGGEEHSTLPARHVLDTLRQSGAALHVMIVSGGALRSTVTPTRPSALLEENLNLSEVLGDGPRQSGGTHTEIVATTGVAGGLQQLADALTHQYRVDYAIPDGAKPSSRLSVSVKRKGVTLRAPTAIPDR